MIESKDIQLYKKCMTLIKFRLSYIDSVIADKHILPSKLAKHEFLYFQFRIVFETIAVSSLCSNRTLYEQGRSSFRKDWRSSKIFATIKRHNPNFYPWPVIDEETPNGIEFKPIENGYLTLDELKKCIGICGDNLHAYNVYSDFTHEEEVDVMIRFKNWRSKLVALLNQHVVYVHPGICLRVIMNSSSDGEIKIMQFELTNKQVST